MKFILTAILFFCLSASAQKTGNIYGMVGGAVSSTLGVGVGLSTQVGVKGKGTIPIGLGADFLRYGDLDKIYIPVYLNIAPFYKQYFGTIQVGYVGYKQTT